ncbi:hypothetical protein DsansV1_C08g0084751 [Dioscorea sansibarensis]
MLENAKRLLRRQIMLRLLRLRLFEAVKEVQEHGTCRLDDGNGEVKRHRMRAIDIFSLPPGERVIVDWNRRNQSIDMIGGLLVQFLWHIATNCENFPIGYDKWQTVPKCYKDHVWDNIIKTKLEVNGDGYKDYIFKSLGKNSGTIDVTYITL